MDFLSRTIYPKNITLSIYKVQHHPTWAIQWEILIFIQIFSSAVELGKVK